MNIVVRSLDSYCVCRPDTTWERENKDIYAPESVVKYDYAPVLFVRICKAGKCVAEKFASRYYDGFNYGLLLTAHLKLPSGDEIVSDCLDHSSILPFPLYNPVVLENEDKSFTVEADGKEFFSTSEDSPATVHKAIYELSAMVSLRIGDIVAVELQRPQTLCGKDCGEIALKGNFFGNETFSTRLIF